MFYLKKCWDKFSGKPEYNKKDNYCIVNIISEYPNLSLFMYIFVSNAISSKQTSNIDITVKKGIHGIFLNIFNNICLDVLPNNLLFCLVKGCINGYMFNSLNTGVYTMFTGISRCRYSLRDTLFNKGIYLFGIFCISRYL